MPPLRRRYWVLSATATTLFLALAFGLFFAGRLWAQGELSAHQAEVVNWISFSGVVALCGLAVQWGSVRERIKANRERILDVEDRIDRRFDRVERQLDVLFDELGVERRAVDRRSHGARVDRGEPDGG